MNKKSFDTCLHGCYYVDTDQECNIDKEFCKREVKYVWKQLVEMLLNELPKTP